MDHELKKLAGIKAIKSFFGKVIPKTPTEVIRKGRLSMRAPEGTAGGFKLLAERLQNPIKGMAEGWKSMTPGSHPETQRNIINAIIQKQRGRGFFGKMIPESLRGSSAEHIARIRGDIPKNLLDPKKAEDLSKFLTENPQMLETVAPGTSLLSILKGTAKHQPTNKVQALAEELSRRGWTGKSRALKYVPVGEKSWLAGFAAPIVPTALKAPAPTQAGEGGALEETLGGVGDIGGWILGAGAGIPGMAAWYAGSKAGRAAGRVLDRMRAGANIGDAISAPSPTEAQEMMGKIQRYHL